MADLVDEIVERIALRFRFTEAIKILETLPGPEERMSLLADIIAPRPLLEEASLAAATQALERDQGAR